MAGVPEHLGFFFEQTLEFFFREIAIAFGFVIEHWHIVRMDFVHQKEMVLMPADYVSIKNAAAQIFECKIVDKSHLLCCLTLESIVLRLARS